MSLPVLKLATNDKDTAGLAGLQFDNKAVRGLPADPGDGHDRRRLKMLALLL